MRIDDILMRSYERLPEVIATLPAPALLRELDIHIPYEAATVISGPLDSLDDILFGAGPAETIAKFNTDDSASDARATQRFDALTQLRVVLLTSCPLSKAECAETDWGARLHMPRAAALGRLEVRFGRDERCVPTRIWSCECLADVDSLRICSMAHAFPYRRPPQSRWLVPVHPRA